jgi:hypothetical protein
MTEVVGSNAASNPSGTPDPDNPSFWIDTHSWLDPPTDDPKLGTNEFLSTPRPFILEKYRQTATPFQWNRYVLLGFCTHIDGNKFDSEWSADPVNLIQRNKIVWYNFMYYVDRKVDIPSLLENWALHVAQPYLLEHDPSFLQINTLSHPWTSEPTTMEVEEEWTTVGATKIDGNKKKHVTLNEPAHRIRPPNAESTDASVSNLAPLTSLRRAGILKKPTTKCSPKESSPKSPHQADDRKPAWTPTVPRPTLVKVPPSPPLATPPPATARIIAGTSTNGSVISETSTLYPDSYSSNKQVQTHDGTQRITIRWTPTAQLSYKEKPDEWKSSALTMFQDLFGSDMSAFYPWGIIYLPR